MSWWCCKVTAGTKPLSYVWLCCFHSHPLWVRLKKRLEWRTARCLCTQSSWSTSCFLWAPIQQCSCLCCTKLFNSNLFPVSHLDLCQTYLRLFFIVLLWVVLFCLFAIISNGKFTASQVCCMSKAFKTHLQQHSNSTVMTKPLGKMNICAF